MENQNDILKDELLNNSKRRELLPWWIKVFIWIFFLFGAMIPFALIFGILGNSFQVSLYGIETDNPISFIGLILLVIFLLKTIVAYGLWTEKNWAITLGIADGILGILICSFIMLIAPILSSQNRFIINFRLELILLVPYLIKLLNLRHFWHSLPSQESTHP